jgi:hydrogenase maturation protease
MMRILIAGIGNIFLGDDAFGCEVATELANRELPEGVSVIDFGIRSYDLAYAIMEEWDAVLLVDAVPRGESPGTLFLFEPDSGELEQLSTGAPDAHSMNPMTALQLVRALGGEARRLYVVGCEPAVLETEEIGLSGAVRAAILNAMAMIEAFVQELMETRENSVRIESGAGSREA